MLVIKEIVGSICHIIIIPRYSFYNFIDRHIIRTDIPSGRSTSVLVIDKDDQTKAPSAQRGVEVLIETLKHHIRRGTLRTTRGDYKYPIPGDVLSGGILYANLIGRSFLTKNQVYEGVSPTKQCAISINFEVLPVGAGIKSLKKKIRSMLPVEEKDILRPHNWKKIEKLLEKESERFGLDHIRLRVVHHAHIVLNY